MAQGDGEGSKAEAYVQRVCFSPTILNDHEVPVVSSNDVMESIDQLLQSH